MDEPAPATTYVNEIDGLYNQISRDLALGPDLVHVDEERYGSDEDLADAVLDRLGTIEAYHGDLTDIIEARDNEVTDREEAYDLLDSANTGSRGVEDHLDLAEAYVDVMTDSIEASRQERDELYRDAPLWKRPALAVFDGLVGHIEDRTIESLEWYRELVEDVRDEHHAGR
jgi:hypothetical protein